MDDFHNVHKHWAFYQHRWTRTLEISSTNSIRKDRDCIEVERKKRAQSRIMTLKVRYFPRVVRNPLREVSYWPRNSIKRSNIEGPLIPYIENNSEIIAAVSSLDPSLFPKQVSTYTCQVERQITFPRNSLRENGENYLRKVSPFFSSNSRIERAVFANSASKIRNTEADCEKSNWSNGLRVTYG